MLKKIFRFRVFVIASIFITVIVTRHILNMQQSFFVPEYNFEQVKASDSYDRIFRLTGLSPCAAKEFMESGNFETVQKLNKLYFNKPAIDKQYILYPFTAEEKIRGEAVPLAPLKKGDILVTFSTHTADWRHGHMAIVTNPDEGIVLEHIAVGIPSCLRYVKRWETYPNFAILRYPDEETAKHAALYAEEKLLDVKYSIFAGLIKKDKSAKEKIDSSHCSHIVWQAYKAVGVDLDSDGGKIVTPKDVAMSDSLEAVQIYGLDPKDYEDRILKDVK